jgi:hypothetical protein
MCPGSPPSSVTTRRSPQKCGKVRLDVCTSTCRHGHHVRSGQVMSCPGRITLYVCSLVLRTSSSFFNTPPLLHRRWRHNGSIRPGDDASLRPGNDALRTQVDRVGDHCHSSADLEQASILITCTLAASSFSSQLPVSVPPPSSAPVPAVTVNTASPAGSAAPQRHPDPRLGLQLVAATPPSSRCRHLGR